MKYSIMNSIILNKTSEFLFLICLFALTGCSDENHNNGSSQHNVSNEGHVSHQSKILVSKPDRRTVEVSQSYVAQVRSSKHIEIKSMAEGFIDTIHVREGQYVEKGQLLFQVLPPIYEAELKRTEAEADAMLVEFQNTKLLADRKIVSERELAIAEAKLRQANAEVDLAKTHLGFTRITAPFSGIVDRFELRTGSLIEEGERLTNLSDNQTMWVYFNVPEAEYLDYARSKNKNDDESVTLMMADESIFDQPGQITTIEADFNNRTGTIPFRADFSNPDLLLRDGQTGTIILSQKLPNALVIPQKATFEILDQTYVYTVDKEGTVHQKHIQIAYELEDIFVVQSGIAEDERLIIEGLRQVRDGGKTSYEYIEPNLATVELKLPAE